MRPVLAVLAVLATIALLAAAPAGAGGPGSVHERVAEVLRAYGGWDKLAPVRDYRGEGDLFSPMRNLTVPTTRVFARPDRLKTLMDYPGALEARLVDGAHGWRTEHGAGFTEVTGPMYMAMALQAARCDLPWILAERESLARILEPREQDGVKLPGLEIPLGEGLVLRAWMDPATHLVTVSQGTLVSGPMATQFETRYSDYREVNGVKFAFHEENFASGTQTGVTTVKRVVVNPPLSPTEFAPPAPPDSTGKPTGHSQG
jgi:hypothetical protein